MNVSNPARACAAAVAMFPLEQYTYQIADVSAKFVRLRERLEAVDA